MDKNIVTYGLIGHPVGHSFSASFFNDKFSKEGLVNDFYAAFDIEQISDFPSFFESQKSLKGFNVTSPWKEEIIQFLDDIMPDARDISAVNCVKIINDSDKRRLIGYNTDIYGFRESLRCVCDKRADRISTLVLGSGGASRAVKKALEQLGITFSSVSRDPRNGLIYRELTPEIIASNKLIINATPLGMGKLAGLAPSIPYDSIGPDHLCFDLIYNPEETEFLRLCREQGARTKNGLEMLRLQALKSWEIWTT